MAEAEDRSHGSEHQGSTSRQPHWLTYLPILLWLPSYKKQWLRSDLLAGVATWTILVPQAIAYAQVAGMHPQAALFAAPIALLAYACFGTSRQLVVGVTSSIAITSAATVSALAPAYSAQYMALTIELALLVGVLFLICGAARLGFISEFLAGPVVTGFLFGLSLVIAIGQVPKLFGLPAGEGNFFQKSWELLIHLGDMNSWTFLTGVLSLALMFMLKRFAPRAPIFLITGIFGTLFVSLFNLAAQGVDVIGVIPGGIPTPALPDLRIEDLLNLLPGAAGIVLVGFAEHISTSRGLATDHRYDINPDQELTALGVTNLSVGFFQGFALSGGLSQSTVNDQAGARSQFSSLVAAALLLITLAFLTPLFHNLPQATLGAMVIYAVSHSWKVQELQRYFRLKRSDCFLALAALLGELLLNVLPGLLIAALLSLLILIYRASRPHVAILGKVPGGQSYSDKQRHPENLVVPGLLIVRLDAPLFFANAALLREHVKTLMQTTSPRPEVILLDIETSTNLDIASLDMLAQLRSEVKGPGSVLALANVRTAVRELLERDGLTKAPDAIPIYSSVGEGANHFLKERRGRKSIASLQEEKE